MTRVPAEHGLRLGDRGEMIRPDKALHRDRPQVADVEVLALLERLRAGGVKRDAEAPGALEQPEEHALGRSGECAGLVQREQRIEAVRILLEHHELAADHIGASAAGNFRGREKRLVGAPLGGPIERIGGISEQWFRTEIGTRRHWSS